MRSLTALLVVLLLILEPSLVPGQELSSPRGGHPWGRFKPGAWKQVRILKETLDDKGAVISASTTDTRTTLEKAADSDYTLMAEVTIEVARKRYPTQPQVITQGYFGESAGQTIALKKTGSADVTILGKPIPCEVRSFAIQADGIGRTTTLHISEKTSPQVLRSQTVTTNADGKTVVSNTTVEVLSLDMPYKVGAEIKNVAWVRTVQSQAKGGTKVTLEATCSDVPGGVVYHSERETNDAGRTVSRSILELIDYGTGGDGTDELMGRRRLFHNRNRTRTVETPERARKN